MAIKVHGDFSLEVDPRYHLVQQLPADSNIFAAASLAAEKVLSFPENELEQRFIFNGIPCKNDLLPPDFSRAIPGTDFAGYDINVPAKSELGLRDVRLKMHDAKNPNRRIKIQTEPEDDDTADFKILDNFPGRRPKSAKQIGRDAIRNFLQWQLQAQIAENPTFELADEQQLSMLLGQYALSQHHIINTAQATLSENRVLHAEREQVFDSARPSGAPVRITHSLWLTALLEDELIQLGENIRARTIARLDAGNFWHPGNILTFEVEAASITEEDSEELTKRMIMLQRSRKVQTARSFTAVVQSYLQQQRS